MPYKKTWSSTLRKWLKKQRREVVTSLSIWLFQYIQRLPYYVLRFIACFGSLSIFAFALNTRRRIHARLDFAFPEKRREYKRRVGFSMFLNLGRMAVDVIEFQRAYAAGRESKAVVRVNWEELADELLENGAVAVTAHLGAWEILGGAFSACCPGRLAVIAKKVYLPRVNELITGFRESFGTRVIYQDEPVTSAIRFLRRNNVLGVLPDQDLRRMAGKFYLFFGKKAWTPTGPASLSVLADVPVFCLFLVYDRGAYRLVKKGPFFPAPEDAKERNVNRLTRQWTHALEETIRRFPEQWVWFHDRWRTQPAYMYTHQRRVEYL